MIGATEIIIILAVIVFLFGGKRVVAWVRNLGEAKREFDKEFKGEKSEEKPKKKSTAKKASKAKKKSSPKKKTSAKKTKKK